MKIVLAIILFSLLESSLVKGQSSRDFGVLPKMVLSKKLSNKHSLKVTGESRVFFYQSEMNPSNKANYSLSDFGLYFSTKTKSNQSLNLGYLLRLENQKAINRLIQQYNIVQNPGAFRLAHRFGLDQTFESEEDWVFRFRYRTSFEKAITGEKINNQELYYKISSEVLSIYQNSDFDLEYRIFPSIGYEISLNSKVELGYDLRFKNLATSPSGTESWLRLSWFGKI